MQQATSPGERCSRDRVGTFPQRCFFWWVWITTQRVYCRFRDSREIPATMLDPWWEKNCPKSYLQDNWENINVNWAFRKWLLSSSESEWENGLVFWWCMLRRSYHVCNLFLNDFSTKNTYIYTQFYTHTHTHASYKIYINNKNEANIAKYFNFCIYIMGRYLMNLCYTVFFSMLEILLFYFIF